MTDDKKSKTPKEESVISDVFKKAFYTGFGALFMTEAAVRSTLSEMSLPQDIVKGAIQQASKGKEELIGVVRNELKKVLSKIDVSREMKRFLEEHTVHLDITFKKKK